MPPSTDSTRSDDDASAVVCHRRIFSSSLMRSFLMHIADSNLVVTNPYDGQNCFDVGSFKPGHGDGYWNNTCIIMGCRNPTCVDKVTSVSQCDPSIVTLKDNRYYTTHGACLCCVPARLPACPCCNGSHTLTCM
jgi:hypothetical protein